VLQRKVSRGENLKREGKYRFEIGDENNKHETTLREEGGSFHSDCENLKGRKNVIRFLLNSMHF